MLLFHLHIVGIILTNDAANRVGRASSRHHHSNTTKTQLYAARSGATRAGAITHAVYNVFTTENRARSINIHIV